MKLSQSMFTPSLSEKNKADGSESCSLPDSPAGLRNYFKLYLCFKPCHTRQKNGTHRSGFRFLCDSDTIEISTIAENLQHNRFLPTPVPGAFRKRWILERPKNSPPDCFLNGLSNPITPIKNLEPTEVDSRFLVGVAGFEPAASWTRTMRDTKLRHTPIDRYIIMRI